VGLRFSIKVYKPALIWGFIALLVRLIVLAITHLYSLQAGFDGFYPLESGADDRYYFSTAASIASGNPVELLPNTYPYLIAALFIITGPNLVAGKLLNVVISAVSVYIGVNTARILVRLFGQNPRTERLAANTTGLLLTFYPASVFYSTQLLKDTVIQALFVLLLFITIRSFIKRISITTVILFAFGIFILFGLRSYTAIAFLATLFVYMMLGRARSSWKIVAILGVALLPYFGGLGLFGLTALSHWLNPAWLANWRYQVYSMGGSSLGIQIDFSNPFLALMAWLYSLVTVLFGPLPWQFSSIRVAIGAIDCLPVWLMSAIWLKGYNALIRRGINSSLKPQDLLLLFAIILSGGIALFSDNIGANTRLRLTVYTALYIYAGYFKAARFK
jgi:hypothetical protein